MYIYSICIHVDIHIYMYIFMHIYLYEWFSVFYPWSLYIFLFHPLTPKCTGVELHSPSSDVSDLRCMLKCGKLWKSDTARCSGSRCDAAWCSAMQCVTASDASSLRCTWLFCVAVCGSMVQCVAVCRNELQRAVVCLWCSALHRVIISRSESKRGTMCCSVLQCAAVCYSMLLCVSMCCILWQFGFAPWLSVTVNYSELHCVTVCNSELRWVAVFGILWCSTLAP